jgi:hypothetical protein
VRTGRPPRPIGSKRVDANGVTWIKVGHHDWRLEHRHLLEQRGEELTTNDHVHHLNEVRSDNRDENLRRLTKSEHSSLHAKKQHLSGNFGVATWSDSSAEDVSIANKRYSDEFVRQIRETAKTWDGSYRGLAELFGISVSWCRNVVLGLRRQRVL